MGKHREVTAPVFIVEPGALDADVVTIDGAEGKHAAAVRRLQVGEPVVVTDGQGSWVSGVVKSVKGRERVNVTVHSRGHDKAHDLRIVVVQGVPKGERGEVAVEIMTEVGVDVIVPWPSERSQVRVDADREVKILARWRATAREAAKQARRTYVPEVAGVARRSEVAHLVATAAAAFVLDAEAGTPIDDVAVPETGDVVIVVGPEGGLNGVEIAELVAAGATAVRLGPSVLRTSTAGTVAAGIVLARTNRWRQDVTPVDDEPDNEVGLSI